MLSLRGLLLRQERFNFTVIKQQLQEESRVQIHQPPHGGPLDGEISPSGSGRALYSLFLDRHVQKGENLANMLNPC